MAALFILTMLLGAVAFGPGQEATSYAMACALAIVPYVFTRSVGAFSALDAPEERKRDINRLIKAIERGPDAAS